MTFGLVLKKQNVYLVALNSKALKITILLAQFLYTKKRLDLPGIGTFLLESDFVPDADKMKQNKTYLLEGVSFENNRMVKEDPELIQFISEHSGKIKALASADLNSHLELARQFLNIGKPFLFEGIGSLVKTQAEGFSFTPGQVITEKLDPTSHRDYGKETVSDEPVGDYRKVLYNKSQKSEWKKPVAIGLILLGFALAIWGGYTVYKKNTAKSKKEESAVQKENNDIAPAPKNETQPNDTSVQKTDTTTKGTAASPNTVVKPAGTIKFILETSQKERAFYRFNRLKTFQWPVAMETRDSSLFTLYMLLPVAPADTNRILDSLSRLNGKRVYIAQ